MKRVDFLRDLGGFHAGGKRVRYGVLYRSSDFSETSPKIRKRLEALFGESVVIDLRSPSEVAAEPEERLLGEYIHNPPLGDDNNPAVTRKTRMRILKKHMSSEGGAKGHLVRIYQRLIRLPEAIASYRKTFDILLHEAKTIVWHCTQGKDRTGMTSALILAALGVDWAEIREDYLYFNKTCKTKNFWISVAMTTLLFSRKKAKSLYHLLSAQPEYIDGALAAIESDYGSVDGYLHKAIGLSDKDILALREKYLEVVPE